MEINWKEIQTPCYVVDETLLVKNLEILAKVQREADCSILLAQKGFSMYSVYPLISKYLKGTTASSLFEAKLGFEEMGGETHIFSAAYTTADFDEIVQICDHIVFNSFEELEKYRDKVRNSPKKPEIGIRVNPGYSEVDTEIYNPCARGSRLGVTLERFRPELVSELDGIHFHTMCEQNADVLERTLKVFTEKFDKYIRKMKWINFGGGHHITREDYDVELLIRCIKDFKRKYDAKVYLEPGEAIALNTGYLVAEVLSVIENDIKIAILDTSAACHMPDVLEMPYRPNIIDSGMPDEKPYTYRLAGATCLAGDIIGDYSFCSELKCGDRLVFCDMAHYTMVKNNTFNGINLPSIAIAKANGKIETVKEFGYEDFKRRL